jgi:hypothetical protein
MLKFYKVEIKYPEEDSSFVFFGHDFPAKPNSDDIASHAVDAGLMDVDDLDMVMSAIEISEETYLRH